LIKKEWFHAQDRPWDTQSAPVEAIQGGTNHIGISRMFDALSKLKLAEPVRVAGEKTNLMRLKKRRPHYCCAYCFCARARKDFIFAQRDIIMSHRLRPG
jgi:hypothetical protein